MSLQVNIWKTALENYPEALNLVGNGWKREDDALVPLWCEDDVLPKDLVDLLEADSTLNEEDNTSVEADYDSDESPFEF